MKIKLIYILIVVLMSVGCKGIKFVQVDFLDHFNNDNIEIYINDIRIVHGIKINTDESIGLADLSFTLKKRGKSNYEIQFCDGFESFNTELLEWNNKDENLLMNIVLNHKSYIFEIDVNKGNYIYFTNDNNLRYIQFFEELDHE